MKPSLSIKHLKKSYGRLAVFSDFNLKIDPDRIVLIVGPTGIGKTTLLRCIMGLESYDGDIALTGQPGIMFQTPCLLSWKTIRENILLPFTLSGKPFDQQDYHDILNFTGITDQQDKYPAQLSGGQNQRAALARTLLSNPDIILLDEPFNNLDDKTSADIFEKLLARVHAHQKILIIASHHPQIIPHADQIIKLAGCS
jgi:ABC-type nitrate/sulfonate/bicarbonate transport system ATPase subunit